MILRDAIDAAWRQAHGARFISSARVLHNFCRHVGENVGCDAVDEADVLDFLAGNGRLTRYRANKYGALTGFYRYAISRGYATRSPLPAPDDEPRQPRSAPPYVYSHDELRRLFGAIDISRQRPVQLDADTRAAFAPLWRRTAVRRSAAPDGRRCRSAGCGADHTRYQVPQEPPCSCRFTTCQCPAGLCRQAPLFAGRHCLSCKPRRHAFGQGDRSVCVRQTARGGRNPP